MTATQRAVVDDLGNINVHGRSALQVVWKVKDAEGAFLNISASDLFIEIAGSIRVALTAGEDDYSRKLSLTRAQIAALPLNQPLSYALHDETPSSAATIWSGKITAYGFRVAPPGADAVEPGTASWTGATVTVMQGESVPTVVVTYMGATGVAGTGIPTGGTVGQYIRKASATNFDTAWDTITADDVSGLSASLSTLTSADASLTSRVSTEETTRATADTSLTTRLSTEEAARGTADTSIVTRFSTADTSLATAAAATYLPLAGGVMTGVLAFLAGTAALPGLAGAGDFNTGIYGVSPDVLGVSAGGVMVQTWAPGIATVAGVVQPDADATRDLGTVSARWRDGWFSRRLMVGGAAPAGATGLATVQGFGTNWSLIGANTLTDATGKNNIVGTLHYLAAQPPVISIYALSSAATNTVNFGGGSATGNAATLINFYTAAGLTTPTGSIRWSIDTNGHFLAGADKTYDIGASGASRPRNVYVGTDVRAGNNVLAGQGWYLGWTGQTLITAPSDGVMTITNNAGTDFTRLQFGGTSSAFPAIGRNGAGIWLRLADNSNHANLECGGISAYGEVRSSARLHAYFTTAIPAGGTAGVGVRVSDTSNFGVFFGSGAPTLSAAKGSLYLRSDGSGTSDRMYVNTDGATAWTAVTTAA